MSDYRFSLDTYPGSRPVVAEAHPIDAQIYREMFSIFAMRAAGETAGDPESRVARRSSELFGHLLERGIDLQRIRVGSAIASINYMQQLRQTRSMQGEHDA